MLVSMRKKYTCLAEEKDVYYFSFGYNRRKNQICAYEKKLMKNCVSLNENVFYQGGMISLDCQQYFTLLKHGVNEVIYEELESQSHFSKELFPVLGEHVKLVG